VRSGGLAIQARLDEEHVDVAPGYMIFCRHLEGRRPDLPHAVAAEGDQRLRIALIDNKAEGSDRPRPIGA
jgi:hypothetical protein